MAIEIKICVLCKKPYKSYVRNKPHNPSKTENVRPSNAKTCSPKCSRIYNRRTQSYGKKWLINQWDIWTQDGIFLINLVILWFLDKPGVANLKQIKVWEKELFWEEILK